MISTLFPLMLYTFNIVFPVKYFPLPLSNLTNNLVSNLHSSKHHTFLFSSLDGHMLCAQGGAPDYSLSLWDWRAGVVVARTTSPFTLTVHFSSFSQNNIVSCGKYVVNGNNHKNSYLKLVIMLSKTHTLSIYNQQHLAQLTYFT